MLNQIVVVGKVVGPAKISAEMKDTDLVEVLVSVERPDGSDETIIPIHLSVRMAENLNQNFQNNMAIGIKGHVETIGMPHFAGSRTPRIQLIADKISLLNANNQP